MSASISHALRALEELRYVKRYRSGGERSPTKTVKVTQRGAEAAFRIAYAGNRAPSASRGAKNSFEALVKADPVAFLERVLKGTKEAEELGAKHGVENYGRALVETYAFIWPPLLGRAIYFAKAHLEREPEDSHAATVIHEAEALIGELGRSGGRIRPPGQAVLDEYLVLIPPEPGGAPLPGHEWVTKAKVFDLTPAGLSRL